MVAPTVISRADHPISRRNIDPDALKVLNRLRDAGFVAYLVGGSVRDLLLGRRPKDFDIGTTAHPYEIKKLFRNCWIIGRRFRLAHVKFGPKTIEVATFRRQTPLEPPDAEPASETPPPHSDDSAHADRLIRRDNTFGTPEEDAFRRDFTINALFYDILTFAIIDYVGGMADLQHRLIRSIGDPDERFHEDPVRMLRAVALAARLDLTIDTATYDAIARNRVLIASASPARLLEEYYKILRSGAAERTFRSLADSGLLEHVTPQLAHAPSRPLWASLAALDRYRARFDHIPDTLSNPILLGALLTPLGFGARTTPPNLLQRVEPTEGSRPHDRVALGLLPAPRRDVDRLRQVLLITPRLADPELKPHARRGLRGRPAFEEALTWLDVFSDEPVALDHWRVADAAHFAGEA
jgi:poly(A) polymerase